MQQEKESENVKLKKLRDHFISEAMKKMPDTYLNGHPAGRLPNNVHLSFAGVEAETVLSYLNQRGIFASAGSACTANEIEISPVLKAMNMPEKSARGSIRFSLGRYTSKKDVDTVVKVLAEIISSLRKVF